MSDADSSPDDRLDRLAEAFLARLRRGERPSISEFEALHPELAAEIRDLFPALVEVEGLKETGDRPPDQFGPQYPAGPGAGGLPAQLGDFRILREVGRGGMGVVYEAEQVSLGRRVALKVLPFAAALDPRRLRRFQLEAQAAACLHHTHIVPVYAVGLEQSVPYYAMQLIEGRSLAQVIAELRRLDGLDDDGRATGPADPMVRTLAASLATGDPAATGGGAGEVDPGTGPSRDRPGAAPSAQPSSSTRDRGYVRAAARLALQAAEALDHAHVRGILHRDIKPGNLLLDGEGNLWVTDFGLAQVQGDGGLTLTGDLLGTLRYMSPEQALGRRVVTDGRTDVYSLGVTLYELLTLRPAVEGRDRAEILRRIAERAPVPPRRLNPAVPRDLETVVLKAIEKDPSCRYLTAADLAADLRRFLESRPVGARRIGLAERSARWAARNPWVAGLAAALILLLATTAGVTSAMALRLQLATHQARAEAILVRRSLEAVSAASAASGAARGELRRRLYAAHLRLALEAWESDNVARVLAVLAQRPGAGDPDLAGFERHLLWRLCHADLQTVPLPALAAGGLWALSPDGARAAGAAAERGHLVARVWDTATGGSRATILGFPLGPGAAPTALAFSPDGCRLAVAVSGPAGARERGRVRVWDLSSGAAASPIFDGPGPYPGLAFSPDGRRLAVTGGDAFPQRTAGRGGLWVCDAATGLRETAFHDGWCRLAAFSPDGRAVAAAVQDQPRDGARPASFRLRIWDVASGAERASTPPVRGRPMALAYGPGERGGRIAVARRGPSGDSVLTLYHAATGRELLNFPGSPDRGTQLAFSPDGARVAWGKTDATVWVGEAERGDLDLALRGHTATVVGLAFVPDGSKVVTAGSEGALKFWDVTASGPVGESLPEGTISPVVAVSPDGLLTVTERSTPGGPATLRVLDAEGRSRGRIPAGTTNFCVPALSPDRARVAAVETRQAERVARVKVWEVATGRQRLALDLPTPGRFETAFGGVAFSPDGTRVAAAVTLADEEERDLDISMTVWDADTGHRLVALPGRHTAFTPLAFSPDGTRIAAADRPPRERGVVKLWDVATGREVLSLRGHLGWLDCLAFSLDGRRLASGSSDERGAGELRMWDLLTGQPTLLVKGLDGTVSCVAFSPDGRRLASAGRSRSGRSEVHFWDADTGLELLALGAGGTGMLSLAFTLDGSRLFAAGVPFLSPRASLRVWDGTPPPTTTAGPAP
jgi:WD40 repeat protein/serine/threonine protein kinase